MKWQLHDNNEQLKYSEVHLLLEGQSITLQQGSKITAVLCKSALTIYENTQQHSLLHTGRFPSTKWLTVVWGKTENQLQISTWEFTFSLFYIFTPSPLLGLSCAAAFKVRACSEKGERTAADLLKHAGALYPLPLPTEVGGGGAEIFLGDPTEPEADAQEAVSISESWGRGHPGTQASQKYTQIAEEINIPPNGASSTALPPSTLGLSFSSSVPAGLCALLSPRNAHTDLGHCCLHYRCTFYLLAFSLVGPAAEHLVSTWRRAKGGCFCVCFAGATIFAIGAVRINSQLKARSQSSVPVSCAGL